LSHPSAIITGMRTTSNPDAEPEFVTTSFAACAGFTAPADGSPVCDACGWLSGEHGDELAEVRALPGAARVQSEPKRLAS
jgi:hypothetical protein